MSSSRSSKLIFILLILILLIILGQYVGHDVSSIFGTLSYHVSPQLRARKTLNVDQCGFNGDSDLYGVGIRLGYYTQAFAVWFANFFMLEEARSLRAVNTMFMFAMTIGLVWLSHAPSQTFAIEAFLLIQLLSATWYVGALDKSKFSHRCWQFDPVRLLIREGTLTGLISYNVWFWWIGLDLMKGTPCGTYILFMVKVSLYGWFRSTHKVLSVISACFQTFLTIGTVAQLVQHFQTRHIRDPAYYKHLEEHLRHELDSLDASACPALQLAGSKVCTMVTRNVIYRDEACSPITDFFTQKEIQHTDSTTVTRTKSLTSCACDNEQRCVSSFQGSSIRPGTLPVNPSPSTFTAKAALRSPKTHPTGITFEDLLTADTYLASVVSLPTNGEHTLRMPLTRLKLFTPILPRNLPHILRTRPIRLSLLTPLFLHIYTFRMCPIFTYPLLLSNALLSPQHLTLSAPILSTFLSFHRASLPRENRKLHYVPSAIQTFLITIALVLVIELSIHWNHIQGVNGLGTVGQLVPAVLGVGGLVKVVWLWAMEKLSNKEEKAEEEGQVNRCARVYYELKERRDRNSGLRAIQSV